ncbi:hypothetical protein [Amycolatopsis sp. lyj-23]|uniref:hypothetical protein n=1 Tax=Amycolatopsis sp. lyj-23 TaxID=2789283 RepID=UPI00397AD2AF
MMVVPRSSAMQPWSAAIDGPDAVFVYLPAVATRPTMEPHVWRGRSVLIPAAAVTGLAMAVDAVLETATSATTRGTGRLHRWGPARPDRVAECVYLDGPVRAAGGDGYKPARTFFVASPDLRGLTVRLAAYLGAPDPP